MALGSHGSRLRRRGPCLGWLGTAIEIDAQKRAEQALRRSNEELQQFAFAASHDLQEPLRNISTLRNCSRSDSKIRLMRKRGNMSGMRSKARNA